MPNPPTPRVSGANLFIITCLRVKYFFHSQRVRRRWRLHKLKKQARRAPDKTDINHPPLSGIRCEDMINLPSELAPRSAKYKPLLIASFNNGCDRSPTLQYLKKNNHHSFYSFKREKYKLHNLDYSNMKPCAKYNNGCHAYTMPCAAAVHSIKETTGKYADLKVIFHDRNTIKVTNLHAATEKTPTKLVFDSANIIDLKQFASLRSP